MKRPVQSQKLFARAQQILPGGVDSPVRAFTSVGASPLFVKKGTGARLHDVDGNSFIDYVMSWGPRQSPAPASARPAHLNTSSVSVSAS